MPGSDQSPSEVESRVDLPPLAQGDFQVFVNGVLQELGTDYRLEGRTLVFPRELTPELKMTRFQWARAALGIAGTYDRHDTVDIAYDHDGRRVVATGVPPRRESD
jgi:hypothetical protein